MTIKYGRLLHDYQLKNPPNRGNFGTLPETIPFNWKPRGGKGPGLLLTDEWMDFMEVLNPGAKEFRFATGQHTGWVNKWKRKGKKLYPVAECLSMGGNVVTVLEVRGKFVRIASQNILRAPRFEMSFDSDPVYIHKFSCITKTGELRKPSSGLDVYYPVLSKGPLWVALERIELFDYQPEPDTA